MKTCLHTKKSMELEYHVLNKNNTTLIIIVAKIPARDIFSEGLWSLADTQEYGLLADTCKVLKEAHSIRWKSSKVVVSPKDISMYTPIYSQALDDDSNKQIQQ